MILLESKNEHLLRQVRKELRNRYPKLSIHADDEFEMTEKRLHKFLHADNRYVVRENLCQFIHTKLAPGETHMAASALLATGSFVLIIQDDEPSHELAQRRYHQLTLAGLLPAMNIYTEEMVEPIVEAALKLWEENLETVAKLYDTDIWSSGGVTPGMVMVVGDKVQPYVPCDEARRMAFVSQRGCSRFLHEALMVNYLEVGTRYYLTNAIKCNVHKANLKMLQEELDLVRPVKVVAMGAEAAAYLSRLNITFDRTYHPQYWKRFRNKEKPQLIEILSGPSAGYLSTF